MKVDESVSALGALGVLVGGTLLAFGGNQWSTVLLQFASGYLVVGAVATYERKRQPLDHRRLLAALSVPGVATSILVVTLLATGNGFYNVYPLTPSAGVLVLWAAPAAIVPYVYALGRSTDPRYEWGVVGLAVVLLAVPVAFYGISLPSAQFGDELAASSLAIALGCWTAIVPYGLGRDVASVLDRPGRRPRALIALAMLGVATPVGLSAVASPVVPRDVGSAVLATILYGPLVCLVVRMVWTQRRSRAV